MTRAALASFIESLSNTASPNYHHYLTPLEFAQRFGATSASVDAVRSYLRGCGLHVGSVSTGGLVVRVTGTTTDIAHAFSARVETVRRVDGVLAAQLASAGTLPSALAHDIAGVAGLSSVVQPSTNLVHSRVASHATVPQACAEDGGETSTTPNSLGGYTALQEAQLYGLTPQWAAGNVGTGQTIALYELSAYDPSDLATFLQCYSLSPTITPISVDGGPTGTYDDEPTSTSSRQRRSPPAPISRSTRVPITARARSTRTPRSPMTTPRPSSPRRGARAGATLRATHRPSNRSSSR